MSKGLSDIQRHIVRLLRNEEARVASYGRDMLATCELVEELIHAGFILASMPKPQQLWTVRRACASLQRRGLVESKRLRYREGEPRLHVAWTLRDQRG